MLLVTLMPALADGGLNQYDTG